MNTRQHLLALLSVVTSGVLSEKQVPSPIGTTKNAANHKSKPRRHFPCPAPRSQDRGPSSAQPTGASTARLAEPSHQREPPSTSLLPSARVHSRFRATQMFHLGDTTVASQPVLWQGHYPLLCSHLQRPETPLPVGFPVVLYLRPSRSPSAPFPQQREPLQHLPGPATSCCCPPPLRRGLHTAGHRDKW